jgi:hypothetical protein
MGAPLVNRVSSGAPGAPVMKFTLVYEGELRSNDRPARKWEIRKQMHPQLEELWRINPSLQNALQSRYVPAKAGGFLVTDQHHSFDEKSGMGLTNATPAGTIDLCAPISRGKRRFFPLVRDSFALTCALKITFLRKEEPGRVYQGGDIDNRLKTLFDALAIPSTEQIIDDANISDPIYCLMEDDRLITGFSIETHRLLSRPGVTEHHVQLVIEVDVRVALSRSYNHPFLGD